MRISHKLGTRILATLTIILCFIALMLSTPWGSHLTVVIINKTTPLNVVYKDGVLLKNLALSKLELKQNNTEIKAKNVVLKLQASCIWLKKLCINELNVDDLKITVYQSENVTDNSNKKNQFIQFPFPIEAKKITSRTTTVMVNNAKVYAEKVNTGVLLEDALISLRSPVIKKLLVTLNNKNTAENTTTTSVNTTKQNTEQLANPSSSKGTNKSETWPLTVLPNIYLPLILTIENANIGSFQLSNNNNKTDTNNAGDNSAGDKNSNEILTLNKSLFSLHWQGTHLNISQLTSNHQVYGSGSLNGDIVFEFPYQVNLNSSSDLTNIKLLPQLAGSQHNTQLKGDLSSVNFESELSGETILKAQGNVNLTQKTLPFKATIALTKFTPLDEIISANQATTANINAVGNINEQTFSINATVSAHGYQNAGLNINGSHNNKTLTVTSFTFNEISTKSELNAKGKWQYSQGNIVELNVNSSGFTLPEFPENNAIAQGRLAGNILLKGQAKNNKWALTIENSSLNGTLNKTPVNAFGTVAFNSQWQIKPSHLLLNVGDATLKINGYTNENWHVEGELIIPKLEQLIADSRGNVNSTFTIDGSIKNPTLNISNKVKQFYWQNLASPEFSWQASYQPLKEHLTDLTINSEKVLWKEAEFFSVNANLNGDIQQQKIKLNWLGNLAADIELTSKWLAKEQKWQAEITNNTIKYLKKQWQTDKNIAMTYHHATQTLWINQHCWLGKSIELCADQDITIKDQGELGLTANINLTDVGDLFIPDDILITTKLHNKILVKWAPLQAIDWSVQTAISSGNIKLLKSENTQGQPLNIAWQKGEGVFQFNNNKLTSKILLEPQQASKQTLLEIATKMDFTNNQLAGKLKAHDLSLFFLQGYLSEVRELNGRLNADVNIGGDLISPTFNGNINIFNTDIKVIRLANTINNLALNVELLDKKAILTGEGLINTDQAKFNGQINWQENFTSAFNFSANELNLLHPPIATATVSPNLTLELTKNTLKLAGNINVTEGKLTLNKLPTGSVNVSNDVVIVNDNGEEIEKTTRFSIETDININIANNINISGYGFNGLLGGKLQAKQQPNYALQLFGNLTILDGLYKAYGQKLSVNNGRLSFNGPITNPLVDLRASRYIAKENITAGLEIYGPANALAVNLFSTPTKSKAEILSYIIRGKGIDSNKQSNNSIGITLGATLANASGLLETVEKIPLINNLEIEGDDKQASIAGYVGENIYLKYGVGVAEPINELTVRFYLLNRLWIETVSGLERSADLYFSFDVE